ncbi:hypothetical protein NBRC116592_34500 [Colwellia sp. KU-HH00111]|uniref:hypothetical protein n=1 Tax=Colwellia sp. KU-HH00111 TaxID=3127652 RepID=UPI0031083B85
MTVEQFDPKSTANAASKQSFAKQTTTLETPVKIIEAQSNAQASDQPSSNRAAKVGFVSLG